MIDQYTNGDVKELRTDISFDVQYQRPYCVRFDYEEEWYSVFKSTDWNDTCDFIERKKNLHSELTWRIVKTTTIRQVLQKG